MLAPESGFDLEVDGKEFLHDFNVGFYVIGGSASVDFSSTREGHGEEKSIGKITPDCRFAGEEVAYHFDDLLSDPV